MRVTRRRCAFDSVEVETTGLVRRHNDAERATKARLLVREPREGRAKSTRHRNRREASSRSARARVGASVKAPRASIASRSGRGGDGVGLDAPGRGRAGLTETGASLARRAMARDRGGGCALGARGGDGTNPQRAGGRPACQPPRGDPPDVFSDGTRVFRPPPPRTASVSSTALAHARTTCHGRRNRAKSRTTRVSADRVECPLLPDNVLRVSLKKNENENQ